MPNVSRRTFLKAMSATTLAGLLASSGVDLAFGDPARPADEDGYDLWLRYHTVDNPARLAEYRRTLTQLVVQGDHPVLKSAGTELVRGLSGLLGRDLPATTDQIRQTGALVIGTRADSPVVAQTFSAAELDGLGVDGYAIRSTSLNTSGGPRSATVIGSSGPRGVLYGAFGLLRLVQTQQSLQRLDIAEHPANRLRMLNHWDNINDTVERGYAGSSIFEWSVPGLSPRVTDYARALASIGICQTVVNNVNANPQFLTTAMLEEVALVADALRPWGVRLMLSANFASPIVLGKLPTADPLSPDVRAWWRDKADEIYAKIPDFGGFLVKANSEGQPGPTDYGRTHADGANVIADAVAPHGGVTIWRAFVYDLSDGDVSTDAYHAFKPLDGRFADNAVVQAKYGPVDFHIREPVHPLFGALPHTNMTLELQITQEHTGHQTDLCTFAPWWKHVLDFDTYANGRGTTVASVISGQAFSRPTGGMAGVSNFGADRNWTGNHLAQMNSYTFGRLAWNPELDPEQLASEWIRMTFGSEQAVLDRLGQMLLSSWQTFENYTSPLGIGNLVNGNGDHYDPDPAAAGIADEATVGNDRTAATGTGFTGLYHQPWSSIYESLRTCPDELLLFIHRVPYGHRLHSGKTVIQHIYDSHFNGLATVADYRATWRDLRYAIDSQRYREMADRFDQYYAHATLWRDTIVGYFFRLSSILDEHRSWLQFRLATAQATVVLGGWPNTVAIEVGNASAEDRDVTARLDVPQGWRADPVTEPVGSKEFKTIEIPVTPATVGAVEPVNAQIEADDLPVLGEGVTTLVVAPAGQRSVLALDGGSATSPLLIGYQRLSPESSWDADRGYGWVNSTPQQRDRGAALDTLRRDFCGDTKAATLRLSIPAGRYPAYLLVGDVVGSQPTIVTADGSELARSRTLAGNEFQWLSFNLDGGVDGRNIDLQLSSTPGEYWHLNALAVVDPNSVLPDVVIAQTSAQELLTLAGYPAKLTATVQNTTDAPATVTPTVTADPGYQVSIDPNQLTLPAGARGTINVTVVRTAGTGNGELVLTVQDQKTTLPLIATDNAVRVATMSASSTLAISSPALANNGSTDSEQWGNGAGGWNDGTANTFPDTLTASWDEPVNLSTVRVYTLNSRAYPASAWGLRDYDIDINPGNGWTTVAQIRANTAGMIESRFDSTPATAIRLTIHDTNDHGYSRVMELEAYA